MVLNLQPKKMIIGYETALLTMVQGKKVIRIINVDSLIESVEAPFAIMIATLLRAEKKVELLVVKCTMPAILEQTPRRV